MKLTSIQGKSFVLSMMVILGVWLILAACPAIAVQGDSDIGSAGPVATVSAEEIAALKQTIADLQTRLDALEKQAKATTAALPKTGENSVTAKSKLRLDGYAQIQYRSDHADSGVDQFLIRRIRLVATAAVNPKVSAKAEMKLESKELATVAGSSYNAGTQVQLRQMWIDYAIPDGKIRAGRTVIPFGYEVQASSAKLWASERSMVADKLFPDQVDNGVQVIWNKAENKPTFAIGLYNGMSKQVDEENHAKDPVISYNLPFKNGAAMISYYRGRTGSDADDSRNRTGIGLKWNSSRLEFMGEYIQGQESGKDVNGWYSQLGYKTAKSSMFFVKYDAYDKDTNVNNNMFKRTTIGWYRDLDAVTRLTLSYELRKPDPGASDYSKYNGNVFFTQWQAAY